VANKRLAQKELAHNQEMHRKRIQAMKPTIDTKAPSTLYMRHLHCNLKREQLLEERYQQIDSDNRMLLQKMSDIMRKPISLNLAAKKGPSSLNHAARKAELKKITYDNHRFLHQLQRTGPVIDRAAMEEHAASSWKFYQNSIEYPDVLYGGKAKSVEYASRQTGGAGVFGNSRSAQMYENAYEEASQYAQQEESRPAAVQDNKKLVRKEGQQIGNEYFLIEMATDGRTLEISAYDQSCGATYTLTVNEKNHRALVRETNQDYGKVAGRLAIKEKRLVIEPAKMDAE